MYVKWLPVIPFIVGTGVMAEVSGSDPISGGAGWVGAGLLGLVLFWLLWKHLPDKDKQIEKKDQLLREMITDKDTQLARKDEANERKDKLLESVVSNSNAMVRTLVTDSGKQVSDLLKDKDSQIERVMEAKRVQLKEQLAYHDERMRQVMVDNRDVTQQMHTENRARLDQVVQHCKEENAAARELMQHDLGRVVQSIEELVDKLDDITVRRRSRVEAMRYKQQEPPQGNPAVKSEVVKNEVKDDGA